MNPTRHNFKAQTPGSFFVDLIIKVTLLMKITFEYPGTQAAADAIMYDLDLAKSLNQGLADFSASK
jgi:hypothetical protein